MSLRKTVYYCALCGGWATFLAWAVVAAFGLQFVESDVLFAAVLGGIAGFMIAAALGTFDSLLNTAPSQRVARILTALLFGFLGGVVGGLLGDLLTRISPVLRFAGWALWGAVIGATINSYDVLQAGFSGKPVGLAGRKSIYAFIGGAMGGAAGGLFFSLLDLVGLRDSVPRLTLATSLVILGLFMGVLVGLSQMISKETWIRVESGFRPGQVLVLAKAETTLGRAESCDLGLLGDPSIERVHAQIHQQGNAYLLADVDSAGGTYLNNRRVTRPTKLYSGDRIRVGGSVLLFGERPKANSKELQ